MRPFRGKEELRKVFDRLFLALASDPEVGPRLAATKTPQRFVFSDARLVLNVTHADRKTAKKGRHLSWVWGDAKRTWEPVVSMTMTSDVANRYFQGKENIPLAIARKIIVVETGDLAKVLDLLPIVAPFHKKWVAILKAEGLTHLLA
jgi:hypothetical protein